MKSKSATRRGPAVNPQSFVGDQRKTTRSRLPVGDSEAHYFTARLVAEYFDKLGENVINKPLGLKETVQAFEIMVIREPLALTEWNQSKAAKVLNVKLTTLNAKIHRYRITLRRHLDSISQPRD